MTDTAKEENIQNPNDLPKDQDPLTPFETPVIGDMNAVGSVSAVTPSIDTLGMQGAGGDVNIPLSPNTPPVVIPGNNGKAPKWFYVIFVLTLIIFVVVTALLVLSVISKSGKTDNPLPTVSPVPTKEPVVAVSPTMKIVPTIEASDAGALKISQVSASDEVKDIEADIKNTDFSPIEAGLSTLEGELNLKTSL